MLLVCDTNVWIEAAADAHSHSARLLSLPAHGGVRIAISKHSWSELAGGSGTYGPNAKALASRFEEVPYWPIGTINELLGTINELSGTFDDIRVNALLRERLGVLAAQGTGLHDRGALIDALRSEAEYFVTSDKGLVGSGPRRRIEAALPILIRTPTEMCEQLSRENSTAC